MTYTCCYCKTEFSVNGSLRHHEKTAKYCLKLQNKSPEIMTCNYCNKEFTDKVILKRHGYCKDYYKQLCSNLNDQLNSLKSTYERQAYEIREQITKDYETKIMRLEDKLENLASEAIRSAKPTTINRNTYINMLVPLPTQERLNELIQTGFERKYFVRGQVGLAEFINESLVQDEENMYYLVCSDTARQVFRFKDQYGNVIKDPCMKQFTNMIAEPVKLKTEEHLQRIEDVDPLYIGRAREIAREFYKLNNDNTELSKAMSALAPNQTRMIE